MSAKGKHVKCKMDLERCLFWDPAGNCVPRSAELHAAGAARLWRPGTCGWWSVLFEVRHLMEPLEALCCPFQASSSSEPTYRWRSVRWQDSRSRRTRLWWLGRVASSSIRMPLSSLTPSGHKDALGDLSAGPDEAQPRPHPHALRAVLCFKIITTVSGWHRFVATHVDDLQLEEL